jgi:hypothetical protein
MTDATFEEVIKLAEQLTPEEQEALIEHLRASKQRAKQRPSATLTVFEVGVWPQGMTLRREDEYGDDGR